MEPVGLGALFGLGLALVAVYLVYTINFKKKKK